MLFAAVAIGAARRIDADHATAAPAPAQGGAAPTPSASRPRFGFALAGYGLFGVGYMTFNLTLLRNSGMRSAMVGDFHV